MGSILTNSVLTGKPGLSNTGEVSREADVWEVKFGYIQPSDERWLRSKTVRNVDGSLGIMSIE